MFNIGDYVRLVSDYWHNSFCNDIGQIVDYDEDTDTWMIYSINNKTYIFVKEKDIAGDIHPFVVSMFLNKELMAV